MGIKDLLRFLKPFVEPIHIKKYSGKRVGIDAYSWLHKGAYSCSMELCLNSQGEAGKRYLRYFMHHIDLLRHYEVTPVVVFDGGNIPCKSATEQDRQRKKDSNLVLANEKLKEGKVDAAIEFFRKSVCITPTMAHQLIQILRLENIEFVVAPYEADAQLAYLATLESDRGGIAAVITEDSDLMAYGCQAVIFKMDRYGNGEEILLEKVWNCVSHGHSFKDFDKVLFTGMCVLAGCDFLPSVPGIGIKRAYSFVSKYRNLDRVLSVMKFDRIHQMPEDYSESFQKAVAVFHHARIYDADSKTLKMMKPLSEKLLQSLDGDLDILGPELPPSIAAAIAEGHLNPITMEAFDHFSKTDDLNPVTIQAFSFCREDIKSTQESCFTLFPASESREEKTIGMVADLTTFDSSKYLNEALALGKLLEPVKYCLKSEKIVELGKIPNNNPFKKRKLEDGNSFEVRRINEQMSVMPVVSEKESENMVEQNNFPDDPPMKKEKMENGSSNERENTAEQESLVTSVGRSFDISRSSPGSQQSVSSKPAKELAIRKGRSDKNMKTQKNGKITVREKNSILKFFRHV